MPEAEDWDQGMRNANSFAELMKQIAVLASTDASPELAKLIDRALAALHSPERAGEDKELAKLWFWKGALCHKFKDVKTDSDVYAVFEDWWGGDEDG